MTQVDHLAQFESLAFQLAEVADALTLPAWQQGNIDVRVKADGSPVTAIDVAVETELRTIVAQAFPDDGFCGEEVGETPGPSGRTWVVDGIDGTRAFTSERSEWSTLIALVVDDVPMGGMVTGPAFERRWYSMHPQQAVVHPSAGDAQQIGVSQQVGLADARVARWPWTNDVKPAFQKHDELLASITSAPDEALRPSWGQQVPNGAMLVAEGRLDGFVMFGGQIWDHAATAAIVAAAGGRFSCLSGTASLETGAGVYTNGSIHDDLIALLNADLSGSADNRSRGSSHPV